jgi:hypothetical protein
MNRFVNSTFDRSLYVTLLPQLDTIGHKYGPGSKEVRAHLSKLDSLLSDIITQNSEILWLVTGDHGCRRTTMYVLEKNKCAPGQVHIYKKVGHILTYQSEYNFEADQLVFDGGILRIWTKNLSEIDSRYLSRFGKTFKATEEHESAIINNSLCSNLGNYFCIAHPKTTFCKNSWIDKNILQKILKKETLGIYELPPGEHGTYADDDRKVLLLSDDHLDIITNTDIKTCLKLKL